MKTFSMMMVVMVGGCAVDVEEVETTQEANTPSVFVSKWNGKAADASVYEAGTWLMVFVSQESGPSQPKAVQFSSSTETPTGFEYEYAWGLVPANHAELGQRSARLETNAGYLSGERCTYTFATGAFACEPFASTAPISLAWQADNLGSSSFNGIYAQTYGKYSFRNQGTYRSITSRVSGELVGRLIDGGAGGLHDSRGTAVQKDVFLAP